MFDFSQTKIHCSALYNIMAGADQKTNMQLWEEACEEAARKVRQYEKLKKRDGPRAKFLEETIEKFEVMIPLLHAQRNVQKPLSVGCKSYLAGIYSFEKYGKYSVSKDIGSRQTEKGKECEEEALQLVSRLDKKILIKNEISIQDEWLCGHPDAFEGDHVENATIIHDVKCPWDAETFFSYNGKELPAIYHWQMQGYMALTGAQQAEVHFCLIDTPARFVKDAVDVILRNRAFISAESEEYLEAERIMMNNMTFTDIPKEERRIKFTVDRNEGDISKARNQVERCRKYLFEFQERHLTGKWPENGETGQQIVEDSI